MVVITKSSGMKFRALLNMVPVDIPGYGSQYVDAERAKSIKKLDSVDKRMNSRLSKFKKN